MAILAVQYPSAVAQNLGFTVTEGTANDIVKIQSVCPVVLLSCACLLKYQQRVIFPPTA